MVNGQTTRYLYENDKVVLEVDSQGNESARNVYGTNLLQRTDSGDTYFYMYNGHGDVTALLGTDGSIAATYYYDAFGNITEQTVTGNVYQPYKYAGYVYDDETGLYYLNARYYDPVTARFLSEDTYTGNSNDPLSLNLYTYCHNEPVMYIDPTGHYSWNNFYNTGTATSRIQAIDKQIAELGKKYKRTDNSALKQNYHATADRLRIEAAQIKFYDPRTNKSGANYQQTQINNIRNEHGWTYSQTQYFNPNKGKDTNSITKVGTQVIKGKPQSGNSNSNLIRAGQELKIPGSGSVIKNASGQNIAQGTGQSTVKNNNNQPKISTGYLPSDNPKPSLYPPKITGSREWNAIRMDEPRDNGKASTSLLGWSYDVSAGKGTGIDAKVYLVKAERSVDIGPFEAKLTGTLGSLGGSAKVDFSKFRFKFGAHDGVGLDFEFGLK